VALFLLAPAFVIFRNHLSGDPTVYFTFIKNFTTLPFQFQSQTVSFGATSPVFVLLHVPIYELAGEHWILVSKVVNFILVPLGLVLLNRAISGDHLTLLLFIAITIAARPLLVATCQLYESGLAFFFVSLVYYLLKRRADMALVLVAGSLYLIRPELVLVTAVIDAYVLWKSPRRLHCLSFVAISIVPMAAYHGYMFHHTGELLPSSVLARSLRVVETPESWTERVIGTFSSLASRAGLVYSVGAISVFVLAVSRGFRACLGEILLFLPLPLVFLAVPPHEYLIRYLLPIVPICAVAFVSTVVSLGHIPLVLRRRGYRVAGLGVKWGRRLVGLSVLTMMVFSYSLYLREARLVLYDYDTLLLRDLATQLNAITNPSDRVLIYEIQAQYYMDAFAISADAIVGRHILGVLTGEETFSSFVKRNGVTYVVTMNSFNYRPLFANTPLEQLYQFDLSNTVGSSFDFDHLRFTKVLTNRVFNDPACYKLRRYTRLNDGQYLRVCGDWNPRWTGLGPAWNSVFQIQLLDDGK